MVTAAKFFAYIFHRKFANLTHNVHCHFSCFSNVLCSLFAFDFGRKQEILDKGARSALYFNMQPMIYSFYPTGKGELPKCPVQLKDTEIITMNAFKKAEDGEDYIVRLFNPTGEEQKAKILFGNLEKEICFTKYEIKTLICSLSEITEYSAIKC
jgi:alpha-mannosidase